MNGGLSARRRMPNTSPNAYLANIDSRIRKRKVPVNFFQDPEDMYSEIQDLKSRLAKSEALCTKLRTQLQKTESGTTKKQKQVEDLLRASAITETSGSRYESLFKEVNLVKSLKQRMRILEKELSTKDDKIRQLKLNPRFARLKELETEVKVYYNESLRLQKVVNAFQQSQEPEVRIPEHAIQEIEKLREKNAKFRDLLIKMKYIQDHLKEENESLASRNEQDEQELRKLRKASEKPQKSKKCLSQEIKHFQERINELLEEKGTLETKLETTEELAKGRRNDVEMKHSEIVQLKLTIAKMERDWMMETSSPRPSKNLDTESTTDDDSGNRRDIVSPVNKSELIEPEDRATQMPENVSTDTMIATHRKAEEDRN